MLVRSALVALLVLLGCAPAVGAAAAPPSHVAAARAAQAAPAAAGQAPAPAVDRPTAAPARASAVAAAAADLRSVYVPLAPCRIVDTRVAGGALAAGASRTVQVSGTTGFAAQGGRSCGVPTGATAVEASVTTVAPAAAGYLRIWPDGEPMPSATFLNYPRGVSVTNTGTVTLSGSGRLSARALAGGTHLVVDLQGYFVSREAGSLPAVASVYVPVTPCRVADTRLAGGPLVAGTTRTLQVTGTTGFAAQGGRSTCGIPAGATAVEAAVSVVKPAAAGFLRLWPAGGAMPGATFLNYRTATGITNTGTVTLAASGRLDARSFGGTTALVVDVQGYFVSSTAVPVPADASLYVPITPCRVADTRPNALPLGTALARTWQVTGSSSFAAQGGRSDCGIPDGATAVEVSLSAVTPPAAGFLRSWPSDAAAPAATVMTFSRGQSITNTGAVTLSALGSIEVRPFGSATHAVADAQGYFVVAAGTGAPAEIVTTGLADAVHGLAYSASLEATGGVQPYYWTADGLPSGLQLDSSTGVVSGTAVVDGPVDLTVSVIDAEGVQSAPRTLSLTVRPGLPADCDFSDCAFTSAPAAGDVVRVEGADVTRVGRDGTGAPVSVDLSENAPAVAAGDHLDIGTGDLTPDGVLLQVLSVSGGDGTARTLSVRRASLFDTHPDGLVRSSAAFTEETPAEPGAVVGARRAGSLPAASGSCSGSASVQAVPTLTTSVDPSVTVLWGHNLFGFGDVFVGTGGLELFQFDTDLDLTYNLRVSASASASCSLSIPGVRAAIPLGSAGVAVFKLQPHLALQVQGRIDIDTTVTLRCGINYTWRDGAGGNLVKYCRPIVTPPTADADTTGADLTVSGGITASLTYNEAIGITGDLTASVHAGYHPLQHPQGVIDGKVTGELSLCLACILDDDAPTLTLLSGTIVDKVFHTWDGGTPPASASITGLTTRSCVITASVRTDRDGAYGIQIWDDGQQIGSAWGTFVAGRTATLSYIVRTTVLQGASGLGILLVDSSGRLLDTVDPYNGADSCFGGTPGAAPPAAAGNR